MVSTRSDRFSRYGEQKATRFPRRRVASAKIPKNVSTPSSGSTRNVLCDGRVLRSLPLFKLDFTPVFVLVSFQSYIRRRPDGRARVRNLRVTTRNPSCNSPRRVCGAVRFSTLWRSQPAFEGPSMIYCSGCYPLRPSCSPCSYCLFPRPSPYLSNSVKGDFVCVGDYHRNCGAGLRSKCIPSLHPHSIRGVRLCTRAQSHDALGSSLCRYTARLAL